MSQQYSNNASTTLNMPPTGIGTSEVLITVTANSAFPSSPQFTILVDGGTSNAEFMEVTGGAGTNNWNVTRHSEGSVHSHGNGATVALVLTAASLLKAPVPHALTSGQTANDHHAQSHADTDHSGANKVGVKNNSGTAVVKPNINLIPGTNITYTVAANINGTDTDVTINSSPTSGPTGAADGQLNGTYPNPGVDDSHGQTGTLTHHPQSHTQADHSNTGTVTNSTPGNAAADGVLNAGVAAKQHIHGRESYGLVGDIAPVGAANAAGSVGKVADAGHGHNHGSLSGGDHTGQLSGNAEVKVAKAGTVAGTEHVVNFIQGTNITLTVADDSANDKVDVTINSSGVASPATFLSVAKWSVD